MFNNENERKPFDVELLLSVGRALYGTLLLPKSSDIKRALSGDSPLLEFRRTDGRESMIAKTAIVEIVVLDAKASEEAA